MMMSWLIIDWRGTDWQSSCVQRKWHDMMMMSILFGCNQTITSSFRIIDRLPWSMIQASNYMWFPTHTSQIPSLHAYSEWVGNNKHDHVLLTVVSHLLSSGNQQDFLKKYHYQQTSSSTLPHNNNNPIGWHTLP